MRLMGARGTSGVCHTAEMNKAPSRCVVAAALCCCCYYSCGKLIPTGIACVFV